MEGGGYAESAAAGVIRFVFLPARSYLSDKKTDRFLPFYRRQKVYAAAKF